MWCFNVPRFDLNFFATLEASILLFTWSLRWILFSLIEFFPMLGTIILIIFSWELLFMFHFIMFLTIFQLKWSKFLVHFVKIIRSCTLMTFRNILLSNHILIKLIIFRSKNLAIIMEILQLCKDSGLAWSPWSIGHWCTIISDYWHF